MREYINNIMEEDKKLSRELATIKDDFERLHDIYESSKSESSNGNHAAEVELAKVREDFRVVKTQNEFLLEKNETLFKLGRIAVEKDEKKKAPVIEVISDEDDDGLDILVKSALENQKKRIYKS